MATPLDLAPSTPRGRRHFDETEVAYANLLERPLFSGKRHGYGGSQSAEDGDASPSAAKRYHAALLADMKASGGNGLPRSAGGSGKRIEDLAFLNSGTGHSAWKPVTKGGHIPLPPPLKFPPGTLPGGNASSEAEPLAPQQKQTAMVERLTKPIHRSGKLCKEEEPKKVDVKKLVHRMEDDLRIRNTNAANRIKNRNKKEAELCKSPRKIDGDEVEAQLKRLIDEPLHRKSAKIAAYHRKEEKELLQHKTLASPRLTKSQQAEVAQRLCNQSMDHQRDTIAAAAARYLGARSRSGSPRNLSSR